MAILDPLCDAFLTFSLADMERRVTVFQPHYVRVGAIIDLVYVASKLG
jgi:hypothetical protein